MIVVTLTYATGTDDSSTVFSDEWTRLKLVKIRRREALIMTRQLAFIYS